MGLNNIGEFTMFGDYQISKGAISILNCLKYGTFKRSFKILEGSDIRWKGSPYDATINLKATYSRKGFFI